MKRPHTVCKKKGQRHMLSFLPKSLGNHFLPNLPIFWGIVRNGSAGSTKKGLAGGGWAKLGWMQHPMRMILVWTTILNFSQKCRLKNQKNRKPRLKIYTKKKRDANLHNGRYNAKISSVSCHRRSREITNPHENGVFLKTQKKSW